MTVYSNLQEAFITSALSENSGIVFIKGDKEENYVSYKMLYNKALKLLGCLQEKGISRGDEALFQIEDPEIFIATYWACILGGIIPVPVSAGTNDDNMLKLFKVWSKLNCPCLITDKKFFERIKKFAGVNTGQTDDMDRISDRTIFVEELDRWDGNGIIYEAKPEDICFIQFSSGSTGSPKGVVLTHENLLANIQGMVKGCGINSDTLLLSWMPLTHDMGLIGMHLTPVVLKAKHYIMPTSLFIKHPTLWMQKVNQYRVNFTSSPNFGYKYFLKFFSDEIAAEWDLSCVKLIFNGAEPISYMLCERFINELAKYGLKRNTMFNVYGLAEACLGVTFPPVGENFGAIYLHRNHINMGERVKESEVKTDETVTFVDLGFPIYNCSLRICGENGEILDACKVGRIQIKGKNVTRGYYNDTESTEKTITSDGWLDTGDLGFLRNGRLIVTGRRKDLILWNGQNVYPHDIERVVEAVEGIKLGEIAVCGTFDHNLQREIILCFALYKRSVKEFASAALNIRNHVLNKTGIDITYILPVRKLPKTTSGKIQRHILVDMYNKGIFADSIKEIEEEMREAHKDREIVLPTNEVEEKLLEICRKLFGDNKIGINDSFMQLGGDSLMVVKIHEQIEKLYPGRIKVSDFFAYPTISRLAAFISGNNVSRSEVAYGGRRNAAGSTGIRDDIAIIGAAANMPLAGSLEDFWRNLKNGRDCIRNFPDSRRRNIDEYLRFSDGENRDIRYARGAYLDRVDEFDYRFFRFTPREAGLMEPGQRLFLQTAYQTMEDAGWGGDKLAGSNTGVYVGYATTIKDHYQKIICDTEPSLTQMSIISTLPAMLPTRLAYFMDFKGPTMVVDTACSSTLVAVHLACQGIWNGDCGMAVAGGVKLHLVPVDDENIKIGIESSDGKTRAFDKSSHGTGIGEGVAAVLLKPLSKAIEDGDSIYAVIKGSAVNQDGKSMGITAPNPEAQAELILKAWSHSRVNPETITYILAHGTGTELGDPVEIEGIKKAFEMHTAQKQFCAVGSVKNNIGHLYEGAGIANLITAVLAMKNAQIPPTIHFKRPNSRINFEDSPVYVNDRLRGWERSGFPRRCGVSSFGFSGTNCHIVLEEAPEVKPELPSEGNVPNMFVLSAKSRKSLEYMLQEYLQWIKRTPEVSLSDVCFSASIDRGHYNFRVSFPVSGRKEFEEKLERILHNGLDNPGTEGIFYSEHRLLASSDTVRKAGDLVPEKLKELVEEASTKLRRFVETGRSSGALLEELCFLYSKGSAVDWETLYRGRNVKRVRIPVYQFDKSSCWVGVSGSKRAEIKRDDEKGSEIFFGVRWVTDESNIPPQILKNTGVIVFKGNDAKSEELCAALKQMGNEVFEVELGSDFKKYGSSSYSINSSEEDYLRLFRELKESGIRHIFHTMTLDCKKPEDVETLREIQNRGVISLFNISKALKRADIDQSVSITLISACANSVDGNESITRPEHAAMFGLARVIQAEMPKLKCNCIDIDESIPVELIISESMAGSTSRCCAFRNGNRYVEELYGLDVQESEYEGIDIKEDGVYVITGGFGGIGLEIAKQLACFRKLNLVLVSRSSMPGRESWEHIQRDQKDSALCRRILAVKELEDMGARVYCLSVDVSKENELRKALEEARAINGKINGVIHSAGIAGSGLLASKSESDFRRVMAPKVEGTWLLDKICGDEVEFIILFSSILSIAGIPGQGDYAAANAYLDAFTHYRRGMGRKTLTINWAAWKEVGMAVEHGANTDTFFKALTNKAGGNAFKSVLGSNEARVIIGEMNPDSRVEFLADKVSIRFSPEIRSKLERHKRRFLEDSSGDKTEVRMKGKADGRNYTGIEKILAGVCSSVMGYDEVDIHENFFDLGGDSLLLVKLHKEIDKHFPGKISINDLFSYPSISLLAEYIAGEPDPDSKSTGKKQSQIKSGDIAVIGMAARFPGADDINEFWDNITRGRDCIVSFPEGRLKDIRGYIKNHMRKVSEMETSFLQGGFLNEIDKFDYSFFKLTPKEAAYTDPNQRIFMETAMEAIEDAGYGGNKLSMSKTGVFVGFAKTPFDYDRIISDVQPSMLASFIAGNLASVIPSRIAYFMNLKGPTAVVDTACSSALVSVHMACRSIRDGECDMALAGSIKLNLMPFRRDGDAGIGIESSDDRTRAFDDSSDGTGIGEGAGVVILKPLEKAVEDGDSIYAVIKGSSLNQDGASAGLTAPNSAAQAEVLSSAWENAGIEPETIRYIEAHGTGTKLGDPIEVDGLTKAFSRYTDSKQFCAIGSVKTNMGHLYEGAGIASLIKAIMSVNRGLIPPNLHFERPNRKIPFEDSPVYVNEKLTCWKPEGYPRRAGVSAFGLSGTNCHLVLEQAPEFEVFNEEPNSGMRVFVISAKTEKALMNTINRFIRKRDWWYDKPLAQICYTLCTGRGHYRFRLAFTVKDKEELLGRLEVAAKDIKSALRSGKIHYSEGRGIDSFAEEEAKRELGFAINHKLQDRPDYANDNDELLEEVCEAYVKGAPIEWKLLFKDQKIRRVSLPAYSFEKNRCWLEFAADPDSDDSIRNSIFHEVKWIQEDLGPLEEKSTPGYVLVFKDNKGNASVLIRKLKELGKQVIEVEQGEGFRILGDDSFRVGCSDNDYVMLFKHIGNMAALQILHLFTVSNDRNVTTLYELAKTQENGVHSLFRLIKAIREVCPGIIADVVLVSRLVEEIDGSEAEILPYNATLFGLGKIVGKEYPELRCKCIDIDNTTKVNDILGELCSAEGIVHTAYRKGKRYVPVFECVTPERFENRQVKLNEQGVYIITGGTGGIGLELAKMLSSRGKINIALLGRSKPQKRELWNRIPEEGQNSKLYKVLRTISEIEKTGSKVEWLSTDVSKLEDVSDAVRSLKAKYGNINGVIHAAGVSDYRLLNESSREDFERTFASKVYGTWIIDEVTKNENMDFFIVMSSIATLYGAQGQGEYAAANAYLDSFAARRNRNGRKTMALNWAAWKETGMAANKGFTFDTLFMALETGEAVNAFEKVLGEGFSKVVIGKINYKSKIRNFLKKSTFKLSDRIVRELERLDEKEESKNADCFSDIDRILNGKEQGEAYTSTERVIAQICQEELGFNEIDVNANFFDLGGDSILMAKVLSRLDKLYPGKLTMTDIFEYPCVAKLAEYIDGNGGSTGKTEVKRTETSEEEISKLIDEMEKGNVTVEQILANLENT